MDSEFFKAAYVARAHGLKGELFIRPLNPQADWPFPIPSLKIGERSLIVEKLSPHLKGFILKARGCSSKAQAESFQFQPVFLDKGLFKGSSAEFYAIELLGFSVLIEGESAVWKAQHFESDEKGRDFLVLSQLDSDNKSYACRAPFVKDYIKSIDFKSKSLVLKLPEAFLETFKEEAPPA